MMIIKREKLIKKVVGIMIFIMAMITIITNVNSKKIYAYEISPEVNGTVDIQYTLDYEFEEHYKPGESWTCNGKATKTTTFSVPVKVKVTRNTNGEASYSISLENKISNWRLECYAVASGMNPDQGSYMIFEGNAVFNFTDSGEDDLSSIYYGEASDKEVDLTSKGCEFNVTNFFDDNPDWQVDRYIEKIKRVDKITLKFTYPEIPNYSLTFDWDSGVSGVTGHNNDEKDIDISKNTAYSYTYGKTEPTFIFFNDGYEFDYVEETTQDHKQNHTGMDGSGTDNYGRYYVRKNWTISAYNRYFYIHTKAKKYTLSFNADGGILPTGGNIGLHGNLSTDRTTGSVTVTYNDPSFSIMGNDCPSREGYTFNGWYRAYWNDNGTLNHLEQIYNNEGRAVESSIWHWDNDTGWHYIYAGDETLWAGWTRNSYYLDLNATYNHSINLGGLKEYEYDLGTCDVYVYDDNGNIWDMAVGVTDYYKQVPYNYTYEVKNFNKNDGYIFCDNGTLKGSIKAGNTEARIYVYDNYSLAYYDGNGATSGQYEAGNGKDYFVSYNIREHYEKYNSNAAVINNKFIKNNYSFVNYKTENGNYRKAGENIDPSDNNNTKAAIRSAYNNSLVINIAGDNNADDTNIQLWWDDISNNSNYWSFLSSGDGYFFIVNNANGKFLDLSYGNATDLANVQLQHLNWSYAQQWKITAAGNGYYYIASRCDENYRLDAQGSIENSKPGQNVCVYHAINYDGQRWKIDFLNREDYFQVQWSNSGDTTGLSATRLIEYYGNGDNNNSKLYESYDATANSLVRKNTFTKTGYRFKNYNVTSDGSGTTYNATDVIPQTDCQGITLIRNHTNYDYAIKQTSNNSTLHTVTADYDLNQWWSFVKAKNVNAYYIVNQATGQALTSKNNVVKAVDWNTNDSTQLWDLELVYEHEYQISIHNSNQYLTMRDDNYVYTETKVSDTDEDYDYQLWNIEGISSPLYAQWEANVYNLTFDANGGDLKFPGDNINNPNGNKSNTVQVKYDSDWYCSMNNDIPKKEGYTFGGWYRKDINEDISEQIYDAFGKIVLDNTSCYTYKNGKASWCNEGDVTLYAYWIANKYTIVFDANKPANSSSLITGNMPNITCLYDTPVNIPDNVYKIKGWDFVYFNTKSDGSGDNIIPGSTVINLTSVNNGVVTLYAQWDPHIEWNASLSKINNDYIDALDLTNVDRAVNWEHGLGFGKIMQNTLTFIEFGNMQGFLNVEINNVVPKKLKYEFSDTRINSIQSSDENINVSIENDKSVYLYNVSSAASSGFLHNISFNIPDYEAEFDVNKEKEYSAYVDISVTYNIRDTSNEITETRRVYYNLEELDMSKVHSRIRRQPGQANN